MSGEVITVLMFIGLLIGLFMGHPLAFVLGGLAVVFSFIGPGPQVFGIIINRIYSQMDNYILIAVPMFILMARLLSDSGVTDDMFRALRLMLGRVRGGLLLATVAISVVLAATTGIIGASMTVMGVLALPSMLRYGYQKELSTGIIAAGGSLGILIPPSIMLVILGSYAQISVGQLFAAALVPGLMLAFLYALYAGVLTYFRPDLGPPVSEEELSATNRTEITKLLLKMAVPPLLLIAGVLGSIFAGWATTTEAASIGAFLTFLMVIVYRRFSWSMFQEAVSATARTTAMVLFVIVGATAFTGVFVAVGGTRIVSGYLEGLGLGAWGIFFLMMFIVFVLGMFLDWLGIVLICLPIFLPIAVEAGFDPLWFVMMIAIVLQTSFLTPPFGYALFYLEGVAPPGVTIGHIYRGVVPFIILIIFGAGLCMVFPQIITWLPSIVFAR
ncbi:TRAP transporter large permease [Tianweitania sediminis]|uniref:TRAP transporter large permease protein n=1 Tax=Tianweitania sediminis TaxID=1502156 RepID=A0A8J7QZZ4_9HYPH|nr:TRAP transporter large permease subunit [Tianweitania sediminis]MBP0439943.1 TRAP transporter large permease subunit [Tianweitania sediminis]